MTKKKSKTIRTTINLETRVHEMGVKMAQADKRSFSKFIEVEIERLWMVRERTQ